MRLLALLLCLAVFAPGQVVSIGVKTGVPATDALPGYNSYYPGMIDTGRWTIGPTVEFHLFSGLSVEADALYRGYRTHENFIQREYTLPDVSSAIPAFSTEVRTNHKAWDFPLLLKYRFGKRPYRPFVTAGATFSHTSSDYTITYSCLSSESLCSSYGSLGDFFRTGHSESSINTFGPTAGVGVEFRIGRFKLAPEVRYTHLSNPTRNLATVLLGFTF